MEASAENESEGASALGLTDDLFRTFESAPVRPSFIPPQRPRDVRSGKERVSGGGDPGSPLPPARTPPRPPG